MGKDCLWIDGAYRSPAEVYWSDHPFGPYRRRLGQDFRSYGDFLTRVGVKEAPDAEDAFAVIEEIASKAHNSPLDDDARSAIWRCWELLERSMRDESLSDADIRLRLENVKCVPNRTNVLYSPDFVFFDTRAGLAAKFGAFLKDHVISRPLGAAIALAAAGVQELGKAVKTEILERGSSIDVDMRQLLDEMK